jgi:hypothetical protein
MKTELTLITKDALVTAISTVFPSCEGAATKAVLSLVGNMLN